MPTTIPLDSAAPLLCAGVTIWSPLKHFKMDQPGGKLGVQGLGGRGLSATLPFCHSALCHSTRNTFEWERLTLVSFLPRAHSGLGHMAVKLGKALGQEVTVISTSANKEKEAREVLGADHFIISKDPKAMAVRGLWLPAVWEIVWVRR